jgi:hypothetical protein
VFLHRRRDGFIRAIYFAVCVVWCALLVAFLWVRCCASVSMSQQRARWPFEVVVL